MGKLMSIVDYIINGGPLDGKKMLIGVLMLFLPKWFPEIPLGELQNFVLVAAPFIIKWGLASKVYKYLRAKTS